MTESYHAGLRKRQQAQEQARVKSILVFAETLKNRRTKMPEFHVRAVARVSELIRARAELNALYGRKKGSVKT